VVCEYLKREQEFVDGGKVSLTCTRLTRRARVAVEIEKTKLFEVLPLPLGIGKKEISYHVAK
jgi:hypothetical protein